jgi:hypothetical protein
MSESGGDIIIKGGSVELIFAESLYPKTGDPIVYRNDGRKITRIVITGDITFDSGDHPEGLLCEVKATTAQVAAK